MDFTRSYLLMEQAKKLSPARKIQLERQGMVWEGKRTEIPSWLKEISISKQKQQENAIPKQIALNLCAEISKKNLEQWFSFSAFRCRRCFADTRDGVPALLRVGFDYRGCKSVAFAYARVTTTQPEF